MAFDNTFRSPIPGSSLTHKMGDLPHEKPPKYTDPNEALEYFWKQFHRKDILKQLFYILEQGGTIWSIRRAILFKACLEGVIAMNLAIIISPVIDQMLMAIGASKKISMKLNPKFKDKIAEAMLNEKMNEIMGNPKGTPPLPPSALKGLKIPASNDVTDMSQQSINAEPPPDAQAQPQEPEQQPQQAPQGQGLMGGPPQPQQGQQQPQQQGT